MDNTLILVVNTGSTSTKIALFKGTKEVYSNRINHLPANLDQYGEIIDQYKFRKDIILQELESSGFEKNNIGVIIGRGGLIKPVKSGIYSVNEAMLSDLKKGVLGQHASNLAGLIAHEISKTISGAKPFIADPVVVDELDDLARISGHPRFERKSVFHALNHKAIARQHADLLSNKYENLNLIVAHLGGGISVGAHYKGKVIDVNQALDGEGPFSPERSGTLPVGAVINLCYNNEVTYEEIKKMITGKGGFVAYLGTNDACEVDQRIQEGDKKAKFIRDAMAYQVAKEIGAMSTVLKGDVDGILLTGGMAFIKPFVNAITERIKFISNVYVYPGGDEMKALAMNALRILKEEAEILEYK